MRYHCRSLTLSFAMFAMLWAGTVTLPPDLHPRVPAQSDASRLA